MSSAVVSTTRTVVATGGHSGLGFEALKALFDSPFAANSARFQLIFYARDPSADHCQKAKRELLQRAAASSSSSLRPAKVTVDIRRMDLSSLSSVRAAASTLCNELQSDPNSFIDLFLLNAALAKSQRQLVTDKEDTSHRSDHLKDDQGRYETTACVNHVAHLVFLQQLQPAILRFAGAASAQQRGDQNDARRTRIVFTGSALHRSVKDFDVLDTLFSSTHQQDVPWTLMQSYGHSKFLQMLGVRAYRRKLAQTLQQSVTTSDDDKGVEIVVVQPGFVPRTGLSRETGFLSRLAMSYILPLMPFATSLSQAGQWIARACYVDLDEEGVQTEEDKGEGAGADGWTDRNSVVRAALLEKKGAVQAFARLDDRTADIELQEKWWPSICKGIGGSA